MRHFLVLCLWRRVFVVPWLGLVLFVFEGWWKTKTKKMMMMMTGEEGEGIRESEDFHSLVWLAQLVQDPFLLSHSLCLFRVPCQVF